MSHTTSANQTPIQPSLETHSQQTSKACSTMAYPTQTEVPSTSAPNTEDISNRQQEKQQSQEASMTPQNSIKSQHKRLGVSINLDSQLSNRNNQSHIDFNIFQQLQSGCVSSKTVLLIKRLVSKYWQANRPQILNDVDKQKTLLCAYLLLAVFQIRMESPEELVDEKERQLYYLSFDEVRKHVLKIIARVIALCEGNKQRWKLVIENICDLPIRKKLICSDIESTIHSLASNTNTQLGVQTHYSEQVIVTDKGLKGQEAKEPLEEANKTEVNASQISRKGIEQADIKDCVIENKERLEEIYYVQEKSFGNNEYSIMTEGVVTDIDISLALPEQKEDNPLI